MYDMLALLIAANTGQINMNLTKQTLAACVFVFIAAVLAFTGTEKTAGAMSRSDLEIITIDYPPFLSETSPEDGTAFVQLRAWLKDSGLNVNPVLKFLPPARAQKTVNEDSWCASFYPPRNRDPNLFIQITDTAVEIKLARKRGEGNFEWSKYSHFNNSRIALLRNFGQSPLFAGFRQAGAELVPVDTVDQGMDMLRLGRVDYALIDNIKFANEFSDEAEFELSRNTLETTRTGIFIGPQCETIFNDHLPHKQNGAAAVSATAPE